MAAAQVFDQAKRHAIKLDSPFRAIAFLVPAVFTMAAMAVVFKPPVVKGWEPAAAAAPTESIERSKPPAPPAPSPLPPAPPIEPRRGPIAGPSRSGIVLFAGVLATILVVSAALIAWGIHQKRTHDRIEQAAVEMMDAAVQNGCRC